jgi:hypothetical protein
MPGGKDAAGDGGRARRRARRRAVQEQERGCIPREGRQCVLAAAVLGAPDRGAGAVLSANDDASVDICERHPRGDSRLKVGQDLPRGLGAIYQWGGDGADPDRHVHEREQHPWDFARLDQFGDTNRK